MPDWNPTTFPFPQCPCFVLPRKTSENPLCFQSDVLAVLLLLYMSPSSPSSLDIISNK